jgi:RHS repeat-associated protein
VTRSATNDAYTSHPPVQSQTYTTNGLNQYAAVSGTSYTYDGRGNLASDSTRAFTYDIDNHLLTGSAPTAATFTYDPFGRRWTDTGPTYFVPFIYDGPNLAMEYYSGAVLRRYVPSGLGIDQPLVWYEGAGTSTPRWLQADNLGSVVAYSDSSGNQHVTTGYGPFGEVTSFYASRYEYTGQLNIPELNLFDFKARAYDPNLGRFLSADPAGYASDINSYAYVGNDPVNRTDRTGKVIDASACPEFSGTVCGVVVVPAPLPESNCGTFASICNVEINEIRAFNLQLTLPNLGSVNIIPFRPVGIQGWRGVIKSLFDVWDIINGNPDLQTPLENERPAIVEPAPQPSSGTPSGVPPPPEPPPPTPPLPPPPEPVPSPLETPLP